MPLRGAGARGHRRRPFRGAVWFQRRACLEGKGGRCTCTKNRTTSSGAGGCVLWGRRCLLAPGWRSLANYHPGGRGYPVAVAMYGDGAANQGQIWESSNMASLWKLPMIYCIENNQYGMGTSKERSSSNSTYYTMGNHIPGIKLDGMNVLMVREGFAFCKEWCAKGNGPIYVEVDTYRYHGHSMSDPGTTYRNRDEIASMRTARDPVELVKNLLVDNDLVEAQELKEIEKDIRKGEVQEALKRAKGGTVPPEEELYSNIWVAGENYEKPVIPGFVRLPDRAKSIGNIMGDVVV
ncbi:unnamed protein product [Ascophyllum nodosum]